jgi:hypothetical protein
MLDMIEPTYTIPYTYTLPYTILTVIIDGIVFVLMWLLIIGIVLTICSVCLSTFLIYGTNFSVTSEMY